MIHPETIVWHHSTPRQLTNSDCRFTKLDRLRAVAYDVVQAGEDVLIALDQCGTWPGLREHDAEAEIPVSHRSLSRIKALLSDELDALDGAPIDCPQCGQVCHSLMIPVKVRSLSDPAQGGANHDDCELPY